MKKIYTLIQISALIIAAATFSSCDKQLNAVPGQSKVYENLIVDAPSAEVALNGAYYSYALCAPDYYGVESTGNPTFTEILPASFAGFIYDEDNGDLLIHGQSAGAYVDYLWSTYYGQLTAANYVIAAVSEADDKLFAGNRKKEIIAEAKTLRAMVHTTIFKLFGYSWDVDSKYGIILRNAATAIGNVNEPRSTVKETYDSILADLDDAIANAADVRPNYYVNKNVAKLAKARVLMMRGQGSDYADAKTLCQDVISSGNYALEAHTTDVFHTLGLDSKEVIFGIQPKPGQSAVRMAYHMYSSWNQYWLYDRFVDLFAESDTRRSEIMAYDDDGWNNGYIPLKHYPMDGRFVSNTVGETRFEMRISEAYMLEAEAILRSTGDVAAAKALVRPVEEAAGVTDFTAFDAISTKDEMMKEIFKEGLRNFHTEAGIELSYMLRFPEDWVKAIHPQYSERAFYVLPLPDSEFEYNTALSASADQNPQF